MDKYNCKKERRNVLFRLRGMVTMLFLTVLLFAAAIRSASVEAAVDTEHGIWLSNYDSGYGSTEPVTLTFKEGNDITQQMQINIGSSVDITFKHIDAYADLSRWLVNPLPAGLSLKKNDSYVDNGMNYCWIIIEGTLQYGVDDYDLQLRVPASDLNNTSSPMEVDGQLITVVCEGSKRQLSYNANGATGGSVPSAQVAIRNSTLTVAGNTGNLAKTDCVFGGWNTKADGTGVDYAPGSSFTLSATSVLYAKWLTHTHTWSYSVNPETPNVLTAACANEDGNHSGSTTMNLSLSTTSTVYNGSAVTSGGSGSTVVLTGLSEWTAQFGAPTVVYYTDESCTDEYKTNSTAGAASAGGAPKNVGTYWAAVTCGGTTAKINFDITKAVPSTTTPAAASLTYSGSSQNLLSTAASSADGTVTYAISQTASVPDDSEFTLTEASAVNAGTYYVFYKITGDANHQDLTVQTPVSAVIAKIGQTISAPECIRLKAKSITVSCTSEGAGDLYYILLADNSPAPLAADTGWQTSPVFTGLVKATAYDVYAMYAGDENHFACISARLDVTTSNIDEDTITIETITIPTPEHDVVYDGSPMGPEDLFPGDPELGGNGTGTTTITYTYAGTAPTVYPETATPPTIPGTYKMIIYMINDEYYGTLEVPFEILKAAGPDAPRLDTTPEETSQSDGTITGFDPSKKYQVSTDGTTWADIPDGTAEITDATSGNYIIRVKENECYEAGASTNIYVKEKYHVPTASVSYPDKVLTGLVPSAEYLINDTPVTADASGRTDITGYIGTMISVKRAGDNTVTVDSEPQKIMLTREDMPTDISGVNETVSRAGDGRITGLKSGKRYQYRLYGTRNWTDVPAGSTEVAGLEPGRYEFRCNYTEASFESYPVNVNINAAAQVEPKKFTVTGRVWDDENGGYSDDIIVNIMKGNELFALGQTATVNGYPGTYSFSVPDGLYNIVVTSADGARTTTKMITVSGANQTVADITLPRADAQSKLSIDTTEKDTLNDEAKFAETVVAGLDAEAQAVKSDPENASATEIKIEMKLTPQKSSKVDNIAKIAIEATIESMTEVEFVDIRVEKTVTIGTGDPTTTTMETTATVFEVVIPFNFMNKTDVRVIRYHDGAVQVFAENESGADGTFYKDTEASTIHLFTNQFSVYAVAYTKEPGSVSPAWWEHIPSGKPEQDTTPAPSSDDVTDEDDKNKKDEDKNDDKKPDDDVKSEFEFDIVKNRADMRADFEAVPEDDRITIRWGAVEGADIYRVSVAYCGDEKYDRHYLKADELDANEFVVNAIHGEALNNEKAYKIKVVAYKVINGKKTRIGSTLLVHIAGTKNEKLTNAKAVEVPEDELTLEAEETCTITAKTVLTDTSKKMLSERHAKEFRYRTSDESVATVDINGVVTAVGEGTCEVYVYAQNGVNTAITVNVKDIIR